MFVVIQTYKNNKHTTLPHHAWCDWVIDLCEQAEKATVGWDGLGRDNGEYSRRLQIPWLSTSRSLVCGGSKSKGQGVGLGEICLFSLWFISSSFSGPGTQFYLSDKCSPTLSKCPERDPGSCIMVPAGAAFALPEAPCVWAGFIFSLGSKSHSQGPRESDCLLGKSLYLGKDLLLRLYQPRAGELGKEAQSPEGSKHRRLLSVLASSPLHQVGQQVCFWSPGFLLFPLPLGFSHFSPECLTAP